MGILCSSRRMLLVVEKICQLANEHGFQFVALPHSQLFPQPSAQAAVRGAEENLVLKRSPIFQRLRLRRPPHTSHRTLLELLLAPPLSLFLVYACPEGPQRALLQSSTLDQAGWLLMEPKSGLFFVQITQEFIFWVESRYVGRKPTKPMDEQSSRSYEQRMETAFAQFKDCIKQASDTRHVTMELITLEDDEKID